MYSTNQGVKLANENHHLQAIQKYEKYNFLYYENNYRFKQAIGEDSVYSVPARYNMGISIALNNNGRR